MTNNNVIVQYSATEPSNNLGIYYKYLQWLIDLSNFRAEKIVIGCTNGPSDTLAPRALTDPRAPCMSPIL